MGVFRVNKTKDYTVMSNTHLRDDQMSLKAKGLLSLMLALPDDWNYSISGLATLSKDGKDSVINALQELETFGYLLRTREQGADGRFAGYSYDIFEKPQTEKRDAEEQNAEEPYAENPNTDKPVQLNTNIPITEKSNTNKTKKERKTCCTFDAILQAYTEDEKTLDLLVEWLKVRKAKRAAMTDRAIQMNIDKLDELARNSGMSVNAYLGEVICRGWAAFYEIRQFGKQEKRDTANKDYSDDKPF